MENIYSMNWTFNIIENNVNMGHENQYVFDDSEYDPDYHEVLERKERLFEKCGE